MGRFIKKSKAIWLLVMAVVFLGCEDDDDANLPQVVASFAQTISEDTGRVVFLNLSENADSYTWDFGDGTTSTEINPIKTFPTGIYTVVLTAKNTAGAENTFEDEIFINIPLPITFPVSFDDDNVNYEVSTFNGAAFEIVENPDPTGANPNTSNVGQITNSGAEFEGFFFDLGDPIDVTEQKSVKALFWSDTPIDILLKLEEGTGADAETTANHGGTGWEEIFFTFNSSDAFSRFTLFVDGPGMTAGTFYIDDISQINTADIPCTDTALELPIDFDCSSITYDFATFNGASYSIVDNPQLSGVNSVASKVGEIVNAGGAFEGGAFTLDTPVDFAMDKGITMKVYSTVAVPVLLKFEGTVAPIETTANHDGTGWEELNFTFTSSDQFNTLVLFVDGPGTTAGTFYIDDIEQVSGMVVDPCTPESSQSLDATDFDLTFQTDPTASISSFDAGLSWVDNPDFDNNVNKSCKVGQIDRSGAALFANNQIDFTTKFDFNANAGFKLKVWSPNAGTNVLVKLEDKTDNAISTEVGAVTSVASGWEELTFNFASGESGKYDKIILFFELNTNTTETYYIDDFALFAGGGTNPESIVNGDFETGDTTGWLFFDNGGATAITDTDNNGGTYSAKITSGPSNNPGIKQERFGVGIILPNQEYEVKLDSKVESLLDGAIVNVLAFSESSTIGAGAVLHNLGSVNVAAGSWNMNTFTFTTAADVSGGVSLLIEVVCGGAVTCEGIVFFDNVSFAIKN
ncbi:carbohydrate binding domain-containing protein [Aquimarina sp. 2304DJ70-9]|uniref:carbohydrate binding domain-containing protein n=1 Tax=Aquimarina penaris TaxID=3231044 RepID=UPI003462BF59